MKWLTVVTVFYLLITPALSSAQEVDVITDGPQWCDRGYTPYIEWETQLPFCAPDSINFPNYVPYHQLEFPIKQEDFTLGVCTAGGGGWSIVLSQEGMIIFSLQAYRSLGCGPILVIHWHNQVYIVPWVRPIPDTRRVFTPQIGNFLITAQLP